MGGQGDRPKIENRWWVDQGGGSGTPSERPAAKFGGRFFRAGEDFEQDRAQRRLTDSNLKWFDEIETTPGEWVVLYLLPRERFHPDRLAKVRAALRLPPDARGVLVDSGQSVRAIAKGGRALDRLIEIRLGGDNSFDAWVGGEWVREAAFRNFHDALRRAPRLLHEYLATQRAASLS
ncbi:MAG: hypothetical protein U0807_08440 [Candidatus Binatia bacterium]